MLDRGDGDLHNERIAAGAAVTFQHLLRLLRDFDYVAVINAGDTHSYEGSYRQADLGRVEIDGNKYVVKDGDAVVIPAGARHNVINTSATEELKIYTIYSPPHHKDQIVRKTKEEAEANDEEFDGKMTEKRKAKK